MQCCVILMKRTEGKEMKGIFLQTMFESVSESLDLWRLLVCTLGARVPPIFCLVAPLSQGLALLSFSFHLIEGRKMWLPGAEKKKTLFSSFHF